MKFNLNNSVKVKLTGKGIERIVNRINSIPNLPTKYHTTFEKQRAREDKEGYITMQMHDFIDNFGGLGLSLHNYVNINIILVIE